MSSDFIAVANVEDVPPGACKPFSVGGRRVVIAHLSDGFHAVENRCSHANSVLNTSRIYHGRQIACPVHGARFDLRTGEAKSPPAFTPLLVYPVRVVDGRVEVALGLDQAGHDVDRERQDDRVEEERDDPVHERQLP
jgi:3-phenylpropionate/trans-cinnamate dioxygenase ferredoxin subunit